MARAGENYNASEEEIKTLLCLESMFDFPTCAAIFEIGKTGPIVVIQSFVGDDDKLQKFASNNFPKKWYWSNWGFYVNYEDLYEFINRDKEPKKQL